MKRVANFYHSETPREGFHPIPVGEGRTAYVCGVIVAPNTGLVEAMDYADCRDGSNYMNSHFVSSRKVKEAKPLYARFGGLWGAHPRYPRADWALEATNGDTNRGYWEWVECKMENR